MAREQDGGSSFSGLAKRWLKNQLQVHGDPRRAYRERQESEAIEQEMHDRAQDAVGRAVFETLAPAGLKRKLNDLQRMNEEGQARREAERRAAHEALPRARLHLRLSGDVNGELNAELPADMDWPGEAGAAVTAELTPLGSEAIAGRPFRALLFAIPSYAGPGNYDLARMGAGNGADDWEPLWFQLVLDSEDEPFYWTPGSGPASVAVEPGERTLQVRMQMSNASGEEVALDATIALP